MPAISARIRSASPRWLPSKRAGRWTLRITTAAITPTSTSTREHVDHQREPALVAEPRQRRVLVDRADHRDHDRREEDEEAPEDRRVHQPGHEPLEAASAGRARSRPRCGRARHVAGALDRLAEPDEVDEQLGAPREQPAADGQRRGERERSGERRLCAARLPQLGGDRRARSRSGRRSRRSRRSHDRRLWVGVDREDLLRALAAGDVLRRAADAASDVEVGRDLRAGLADLVGVRPPAGARDDARAADRRSSSPASSSRIPKPSAEPTPRPPLTTTFASASETPLATRLDVLARPARPGRRRRARA